MKPMNKVRLTKLLNISRTALDNHLRHDDAPQPVATGLYDPEAVAAYVMRRRMEDNRGGHPVLVEQRIERYRLQNLRLGIELARLREDLVPWEGVERVIGNALSTLRTRLLAIPASIAGRCAGRTAPEISETMTTAIRDALESAVNGIQKPRET